MSRVSFNRKRVKLKKLLGIRARLALLALILVAPLMLERARSLEDTRTKQIALASAEFSSLAQHSADAQREVISSVETMLKSTAYIRASARRRRPQLRHPARQPAGQSAVDPQPADRRQGRTGPMLDQQHVCRPRSQRPRLSQEGAGDPRLRLQRLSVRQATNEPIMMAAYPVSAINGDADAVILAGVNLDWMSKIMGNLGGRPGVSAVLVDSAGTVLAAPADQASMIGRPLDTMPLLSAIAEKAIGSDQPQGSLSFVAADGSKRAVSFARIAGTGIAPDRQHRRSQGVRRDQPRDPHRLSAARLRLPVRAARRADRRGEAHHPADRDDGGDGQALRPGRLVGARGAQGAAGRIRPAGPRLQRDGGAARPARARTGRHQRPADRDRVDRHAVRASPTGAASRAGSISNG